MIKKSKPWRKKLFLAVRRRQRVQILVVICFFEYGTMAGNGILGETISSVTRQTQAMIPKENDEFFRELYGVRFRINQGQIEIFYQSEESSDILKEAEDRVIH